MLAIQPSLHMPVDQAFQGRDVIGARIQRRNIAQIRATRSEEGLLVLHGDLFKRFQTIGGKAGTDHIHLLHAVMRPLTQGLIGVGLQPFGTPETRLEGHLPAFLRQAQPFGHQARGLLTMTVIGVSGAQGTLGHAVKGKQ